MRFLVTGGAGFIGSHLCEELVKRENEVIVVDNLHTGSLDNLKGIEDKIEFINKSCGELTSKEIGKIDGIFHMGIYSSSPIYEENPSLVGMAINDFLNILKIARETNVKVVWASTSSIYNGNPTPWKEDMLIYVKHYYTETRYLMERLAKLHYDWYKTKTIGMRFFSVYGPKEKAKGKYANLISQFLWSIRADEAPIIYDDGEQARDFIYVKDVVGGMLLALESDIECDVFNLGTGKSYTLNEMVVIINELLNKNIKSEYIENKIKNYVRETLADTSKAKTMLGFEATIDLKTGIKKLINI